MGNRFDQDFKFYENIIKLNKNTIYIYIYIYICYLN
jgi:hypothetical protein